MQVTFSKEVKDLRFDVRDLSWHNTGSAVRESISFSTETTVANQTNRADGSGGGLNVLGLVAAGTEIYRTSSGGRPSGGAYYDLKVSIPGPITTFTLTYGRKTGETTQNFAATQLADFTFCTAW